jgi:hypothetical protein
MVACAALAATRSSDELRLHVNAALNVGCEPRKLTEVFFQLATYCGMPCIIFKPTPNFKKEHKEIISPESSKTAPLSSLTFE